MNLKKLIKGLALVLGLFVLFTLSFTFEELQKEFEDIIDYDVPLIEQETDKCCWAASILMVLNYNTQESRYSQEEIAGKVGLTLKDVAVKEFQKVIDYWEFYTYPTACFLPEAWYDLLKEKGPLIITVYLGGEYTHTVVLKGMSNRIGNPTMYINDPLEEYEVAILYSEFEKEYESAGWDNPDDFTLIAYYSPLEEQ